MTLGDMLGGAIDALLVPSEVECGKCAPGCRWVDRRGSRFGNNLQRFMTH
jgi:hypothetical protein